MSKKEKIFRTTKEVLKTAKRRKSSSTRWLQRQINDPYVRQAQAEGKRSRAAYKIIQIDERYKIFNLGDSVLDLGAAPGSWTEVALERAGGFTLAVDILDMDSIKKAVILKADLQEEESVELIKKLSVDKFDIVLSDMAASTTGHKSTDHIRTQALAELAALYAVDFLKKGGTFCAKVFQGGTHGDLLLDLKKNFKTIKHYKPDASRKGSPETYVIAKGFQE
ncbi:MAG: RlmE family RNA methyltransferase [Alphaproteobacteria bacterium]|jgi:23S rRNA (uridine2552-2'-O)-methyltransferase|nr:RlmE family RNA methyltransferase [Alphaproteobacteria bacterium]MBT4911083.1 RlmE family RNA methyltransferase [Alphaproteobacteria bacterium]MDG1153209.1 RlmE family RNA methyltransferase [Hyphomicrobiales bacterium]|tara:strand:- start:1854 stop:2519 length:666 start_codon:yes stop_codon:yes gene_type:complete